jgi:tRNA_anti-like
MISKRAAGRFAFVALLALVVGGGIYIVTRPRSLVMVSSKPPSYTLTADQLLLEYKANEVAADDKYKGKVVLISGPIRQNGKFMGMPYIVIGGDGFLDGVQCMFGESAGVASLSKDSQATVKGEVGGKKGNVLLRNCTLE